MKKIFAVLLASLMVLTMFAGCGSSDDPPASNPPAQQSSAPTQSSSPGDDEVVTLKWVAVGSGMPANYDAWKANLNAYLEEKIGVHLEMEIIGWGDWDARRNMIVSTAQDYDIMFTNNGTFYNDVSIGAFMDISDLIGTAAPALVDFIPEDYWNACRVDGKLYAVPAYKDSSSTQYFVYDKERVEGTGLDFESAHTMQDLTPILAAMKTSDEPVFILNNMGMDAIYASKYDDISSGLPALGVSYAGGTPTVVSVFEQPDVLADLNTLHEWFNAGYVNSDAAILAEAPSYRPVFVAQGWSYAAVTTWGPQIGVDAVAIQYGDTVLSNSTVQGSMSCISAACQYPEKALQLLELVNTDSYVRDALYFGLEGEDFEYTADGKVHRIKTDWTMAGYTQGTFFTVTQQDTEEVNQWDEVKALNENAVGSPILGFSLNTEPVRNELDACIAIFTSYRPVLMTGTEEPSATIADMMEEMRDAGFDKIMTEIQSQIDAWAG